MNPISPHHTLLSDALRNASVRASDHKTVVDAALTALARHDDAESWLSGFCVLAYCIAEASTTDAGPADGIGPKASDFRAYGQQLTAIVDRLPERDQVRWGVSANAALGYAELACDDFSAADAAFDHALQWSMRADRYPQADVELLRAYFASGYLAYADGRDEPAAARWRDGVECSKRLVPLKDFGIHEQIRQSRDAMRIAMACSAGLSHLRKRRDPTGKHAFDVSYLPLKPSAVHRYLSRLDQYPVREALQ